MPLEDEEMYELRMARMQWLDPDRKEKAMGALKKLAMDWQFMDADDLVWFLNTDISGKRLLGFGEAQYGDIEGVLGSPTILRQRKEQGVAMMRFKRQEKKWEWVWTLRCAWGLKWSDGAVAIIHDRDSSVKEMEDLKHWHVTGDIQGWDRLNSGLVINDYCVKLKSA